MAGLPDQLLQWLYSVLLNEYHDAQRAYSDSVAALSAYPSLSPRTDVYTYNTGQPALLLRLSGTLPVNFRGTVYRFPVTIWLPHAYPSDPEGIMVFVIPGDGMAIRPGQHVSVDGRVYHPYLRDWSVNQRPNIIDFLRLLQDVFAREPPVVARPPQQPQHGQPQSPMQRPPPPPKEQPRPIQSQPVEMPAGNPPPRPPKPGEQNHSASLAQHRNDGPPLPPLPHERGLQSPQLRQGNGYETPQAQRYSKAPPLPHQLQQEYRQSPVSPLTPNAHTPTQRYAQPPPLPPTQQHQHQQQQIPMRPAQQQYPQQHQQPPQQQHYQQAPLNFHPQQQYPPQHAPQHAPYQQPPPQKPAPAQDLLSDPFDVSISTTTSHSAPPIPPNPEKEHLLHLLSQSLVSQIHQKVDQNTSALAPLHAQSIALQEAHSRLNSELSQLTALDNTLASNEHILHQALSSCDRVIAESKSTPQPPIDDVLVAPTVAATQLWNLQADEAAIREALWCLQRAVGAGRVSSETFIKMTRSLARELFLKMALSRKLARGLGLDVGESRAGMGGDDGYGY
ncbi:UEV-domain-containing protein [Aureobasidium pullulans]|nr:UEV-domain-containing protein [Aureobasidium pullulans]